MQSYRAKSYYRGDQADSYVEKRKQGAQWRTEAKILDALIRDLPRKSTILDMPFGPGRFVRPYLDGGHRVCGVDISADMLVSARKQNGANINGNFLLVQGDAESLPTQENIFDFSVCTRFANWLTLPLLDRVLSELVRVTHNKIILEIHEQDRLTSSAAKFALGRRILLHPIKSLPLAAKRGHNLISRILQTLVKTGETEQPVNSSTGGELPYFYHPRADILDLFESHSLRVEREFTVLKLLAYREKALRRIAIYVLRPSGRIN